MSYTASLKFVPVSRQIEDIVRLYLPKGGTIFDPTCGEEMYQLQNLQRRENDAQLDNWLGIRKQKKKALPRRLYKIITSDLKPTGDFIASVKALPLRDNIADLTIYDPPFVPRSRSDERGQDYGD